LQLQLKSKQNIISRLVSNVQTSTDRFHYAGTREVDMEVMQLLPLTRNGPRRPRLTTAITSQQISGSQRHNGRVLHQQTFHESRINIDLVSPVGLEEHSVPFGVSTNQIASHKSTLKHVLVISNILPSEFGSYINASMHKKLSKTY